MQSATAAYRAWAPVVARIMFGVFFLQAAYFKVPGTALFDGTVGYAAAAGLPLPAVAVTLAFVLELLAGVALVLGWRTRIAALLLIPYVIVLTLVFHLSFATQVDYGFFVDHLLLIAGLIYVSAYGAEHGALRRDPPIPRP